MRTIPQYKVMRRNMKVYRMIETFLKNHEKYKSCYFWSSPPTASSRRSEEFAIVIEFILKGVHYRFEQAVRCSCRNVYYWSCISVDGNSKDIRAVKKLIA